MNLLENCTWGLSCRRVHPRDKHNFDPNVVTLVEVCWRPAFCITAYTTQFLNDEVVPKQRLGVPLTTLQAVAIPHPFPEHVDLTASPPSKPTVRIPHFPRDLSVSWKKVFVAYPELLAAPSI